MEKLPDRILVQIFRRLPLDARARLEVVCDRWSQLLRAPEFWTAVTFDGVTASVTAATLAHVVRCSQGTLRSLDISSAACDGITAAGLVAALAPDVGTPADQLVELIAWRPPAPGAPASSASRELSVLQAATLRRACPSLRSAAVELKLAAETCSQALTALPSGGCAKRLSVRAFRTEAQVRQFCEWLARQTDTVVFLDLAFESSNGGAIPFRAAGCEALAPALASHPHLLSLALPNNSLGAAGAQALAAALANPNCALTALDLSSCDLGDAGAAHLGPALAENRALASLNLRSNGIGDRGAEVLASVLALNASLQHLLLDRNAIGDAGAAALARVIFRNVTVQTVSLGHNSLSDAGAEGFARALSRPRPPSSAGGLRTLNLHSTRLGQCGAAALADGLERNSSLRQLRLDNTAVGEAGAAALVRAEGDCGALALHRPSCRSPSSHTLHTVRRCPCRASASAQTTPSPHWTSPDVAWDPRAPRPSAGASAPRRRSSSCPSAPTASARWALRRSPGRSRPTQPSLRSTPLRTPSGLVRGPAQQALSLSRALLPPVLRPSPHNP